MTLTDAALNAGADAIAGVISHVSLHSADPGGTGANELTGGGYARQPVTWGSATGTVVSPTGTLSFSGTASQGVTHVGFWTALSGGTWRGSAPLTGDTALNAAGEYNVTDIDLDLNNA